MDEQALQGLGPHATAASQARALEYFEQLKSSLTGWQLCINTLTAGAYNDDHVKFFCFQVLEHFVKTRYQQTDPSQQQYFREFLCQWIQLQCCSSTPEKTFLRNKVAQVFSLVFLIDYPQRWPTFFIDLLRTLSFGTNAIDIYLRILIAIDSEVIDREIAHTTQMNVASRPLTHMASCSCPEEDCRSLPYIEEIERNTMIKDRMREECMPDLVDSWYSILTTYEKSHPELVCLCLDVIGAYVAWIDISLIANDRFVSVLVQFLSNNLLKESTCDCIHEIISKGMDPLAKTKLVESFITVLNGAGILQVLEEDESDFTAKLAKLINGIGSALIISWTKLIKSGDQNNALITSQAIESKIPLLFKFLSNEYDDVSLAVVDFARDYIQMLKQIPMMTKVHMGHIEALLFIIIKKYKYDESYNFEHEGEDEAMFQDYRKQLKVVFDNLAQLDRDLVLTKIREFVMTTLQHWRTSPFEDVEAALVFLYLLGEAIPASHGNHFSGSENKVSAMQEMMKMLVTCEVSHHTHPSVSLQYFETIVRYEKFFNHELQHLPEVLVSFLDHRGLRHNSPKVRSRTAYLFSRFIKCLKSHLQNYTEDILKRMQDLLVLAPQDNGIQNSLLTPDDQLFLFEAAGILIVSGQFEAQRKQTLMKNLLSPVISKFDVVLERLAVEQDERRQEMLAECLAHAMAVTSRTSKAFSNQQTMKSCGCVQVYLDALQVFLRALQVPYQQPILQSAVRQFLHRMVVCLEEELLPYIPTAAECLLKQTDIRSVQEFIPLINQIISKFKLSWIFQKEVVPFLQKVFMPLVKAIYDALSVPVDESDQQATRDKQILQRSYFLFIASIVTNGVTEVIAAQDVRDVQQILLTIIQGAVNFPDPVAQKTCFSVLRKLVDLWGGKDGLAGFEEFMYKSIVPACFMAPLKDTFDLSDAQTIQALSESALCLKTILDKRGDELLHYLQTEYLPTLEVAPNLIHEYCHALKSDNKIFKNYLKLFFQRAKS